MTTAPDERIDAAPGPEETARAELGMALLRIALVPVLAIGQSVAEHPGPRDSDLFGPLLAVYGAWAVALLVAHLLAAREPRGRIQRLARVEPLVDLVAIGALTYTSGGPYSEARLAFFALPLVAAFRLRPALTALWTAAAIAVYVLVSLSHSATRTRADVDAIVAHSLYLAWAGAGAVLLAALLGARDRRIRAAADERRRLLAQVLTAEEHERRRLAEVLHDDAIQNLLLARQELRDHHRRHDEDSYHRADDALATTVDQLRGEIFELHPYLLDHAGLRAALTAHAESAARRAGAQAQVDVEDIALTQRQEQLVLSLARELLSNAAQHSQARTIGLQPDLLARSDRARHQRRRTRFQPRPASRSRRPRPHRAGHQRRACRRRRRHPRDRIRARRRHDRHGPTSVVAIVRSDQRSSFAASAARTMAQHRPVRDRGSVPFNTPTTKPETTMLFLFFGYGTKLKLLGQLGERTCPRCHNTAPWSRLERYRYLSLFFIRLARWHTEQLEACPVCGHTEAPAHTPSGLREWARRPPGARMADTATLICPKCRGEMHTYKRNGILVDQCQECSSLIADLLGGRSDVDQASGHVLS